MKIDTKSEKGSANNFSFPEGIKQILSNNKD